jgi:hAT family C-terminal dimerisation region
MAVDILSIPAMSAETERVLSDAKLTIPPNRNRIGEDIIEATECLNRWYRADISRQRGPIASSHKQGHGTEEIAQ